MSTTTAPAPTEADVRELVDGAPDPDDLLHILDEDEHAAALAEHRTPLALCGAPAPEEDLVLDSTGRTWCAPCYEIASELNRQGR